MNKDIVDCCDVNTIFPLFKSVYGTLLVKPYV